MTERVKRVVTGAGLVALGALLAFVGSAVQGEGSDPPGSAARAPVGVGAEAREAGGLAAAEERCRREAELRMLQALRLMEFRRFADLGGDVALVVVSSRAATPDRGRQLPRPLFDAGVRREWSGLAETLAGLQGSVDPRVYQAFEAVRSYVEAHPWPADTDLEAISASDWGRSGTVERWLALNEALSSSVTAAAGRFWSQG